MNVDDIAGPATSTGATPLRPGEKMTARHAARHAFSPVTVVAIIVRMAKGDREVSSREDRM